MSDDHNHRGDQAFRKQDLYGRWPEMTHGGALSFLRRKYTDNLEGVDVAVSGVPFDNATTYRSGARLGPRAIREASVQLAELKAFPFGFDPFDHLAVVDMGDCFIDIHRPDTIIESIREHIARILWADALPLTFGGDHFITYPILQAIAAKHGPVALIQFDAHTDTWPGPDDGAAPRFDHGNQILQAKTDGLIAVNRSLQIGVRTHNDNDHGFGVLTAPWVHDNGPPAVVHEILNRVGDAKAYLTFDIDCLDPAFAPGTGTPVPGGLSTAQALEIVRALGQLNFVGADVAEVAPAYDVSEITAIAAATIAHDFLCILAQRKRTQPPLNPQN